MQPTQALAAPRRADRSLTGFLRSTWFRIALRSVQVCGDAALVWVAFWLGHSARYRLEVGGHVQPWDVEPFSTFRSKALLFAALTIAVFFVRGLFRLPQSTGMLEESTMVIGGVTTAMAGVILTAFLSRFVPSRLVFIYAWGLAIALLLARRIGTRWIRRLLWSRNIYVDRVIVVGAGESGRRLMQAMIGSPALGYSLIGFVDDGVAGEGMPIATQHRVARAERLGSLDDLETIVSAYDVDQVIVALPAEEHERVLSVIDHCRAGSVEFQVVPDLLQLSLDRVDLGEVAGVPLIGLRDASIRGANFVIKRTGDIAVSLGVLCAMALPMAIIALWIKRDSQGPIFYRQIRVGKDGKPFELIKFRCMIENADDQRADLMARNDHLDPRLFKLQDDPRLTSAGRSLRRWSLDELPQFIHILCGEMSVVGPRPQLLEEVSTYEEWHRQRLFVTPGLTGLWQINGRSQLSFDDMVRLDLYYAEHWSPWLDLKIVLRTAPAVLAGRGAY